MFRFPFSNYQELNLDWILSIVKKFSDLVEPMQSAVDNVNEAVETAQTALETATTAAENATQATEDAEQALELVEQAIIGIIPDNAVTTTKLADGAVTTAKIADEAVTAAKIVNEAVTTAKIANEAVTTAKIADGAVTPDKLSSATKKLFIPLWSGKHCLIIGDSWAAGFDGSMTVTPWTTKFIEFTGITADIIALSNGGFTVKGNGTYTNVNYTESLEFVKNNNYDCVIVQGGINDMLSNGDIADSVSNFASTCKNYFNCPIVFFLTVPFIFIKNDLQDRVMSLLDSLVNNNFIVYSDTYKFSFVNKAFAGSDFFHPTADGYDILGRQIANVFNGGDFAYPPRITEYTTVPGYLPYFGFDNIDNTTTPENAFRWLGDDFNLYAVIKCASTSTVGFIQLAHGLPLAPVNFANAGYAMDSSGKVFTLFQTNDILTLQNSGSNLNGQMLYITCHYKTRSY